MKEFDKIIGYTAEKNELEQICDILMHPDIYKKLGARVPTGLLLHGEPGVGKSLMADALCKASGLNTFICRKNEPDGEFIRTIRATFEEAARETPSIVFLDDMDKFANEDADHCNAEEYVTVQACIDENKGKGIFVLATANDIDELPDSLLRAGRFDRVMEIKAPRGKDAEQIIEYYLSGKKSVSEINISLITRILDGRSCAELEAIINDAGVYAGFERAEAITMDHLMRACLSRIYEVPANTLFESHQPIDLAHGYSDAASNVIHEAGHVVIAEVLYPGSVTLVSVFHKKSEDSGFTMTCNYQQTDARIWRKIAAIIGFGGKAAIERMYGYADEGASKDIDEIAINIGEQAHSNCVYGLGLYTEGSFYSSDSLKLRLEQTKSILMEQYMSKAREILAVNHRLFERIAEELAVKGLLTMEDIKALTDECGIIPINID